MNADQLAQRFHEHYERLAPDFGYKTREASAVPWAEVPEQNKSLMVAVAGAILADLDRVKEYASIRDFTGDVEG